MNEKRLHRIASCRIVGLCVHDNFDSFVQVTVLVKVSVADSICMTQYRNRLRSFLDGSDQLIGTSGNDKINIVI